MRKVWQDYSDVQVSEQYGPSVAYRASNFVFEEGLRNGRWISLGYNASGYMAAANPIPAPTWMNSDADFPAPQSFDAVVDGQSLGSHLEYLGTDVIRDGQKITARVRLRHTLRPVNITVCTKLDGSSVLERWVELTNRSDRPAAVSVMAPLAGGVQVLEGPQFCMSERPSPYRMGCFTDSYSCHEGTFAWHDLPADIYTVAGRFRRDRHRHPFFVVENRVTGETFIGQFAWSGGYAFTFDYKNENDNHATFAMRVDMDSPAPIRVLAPGETWACPAIHLGCVFGGLDNAVNAMHKHVRRSVLTPLARDRWGWVQGAIGPEYDMSIENTMRAVEHARDVGAELFWVDAAWYCPPFEETEWWNKAGDWVENRDRYPEGIRVVRDKCHEYGMLFGMWLDAERIGPKTRIMKEHPEWVETSARGLPNGGGLLDMSNPECVNWIEEEITRVITEYGCDFYRLDWNVWYIDVCNEYPQDGYYENSFARHHQAVYDMYARLRARFPQVVFENCAGGGGRTDLGMMREFSETWVTDWQLHPNAFRITNGMTMALPPEVINRLVGGQGAYRTGDVSTQMRNLLFAYPSIGGTKPGEVEQNPWLLKEIRHHVDIYKNFVRPFMKESNIYHHTPELPGNYAKGTGVLEMAAEDGTRGIIGVFALAEPGTEETVVYPRGIDPALEYDVTLDNSGATARKSGYDLQNDGIRVRIPGALTSELIMYKSV